MRSRAHGVIVHGVAVALGIGLGWVAEAAPVSAGAACDDPVAEECSNGSDDDGDGWIDCLDPDCVPSGSDFVCGPAASCGPAIPR